MKKTYEERMRELERILPRPGEEERVFVFDFGADGESPSVARARTTERPGPKNPRLVFVFGDEPRPNQSNPDTMTDAEVEAEIARLEAELEEEN